jgi:glycosidase
MIDYTVYHETKSKYSYIFDENTIHLRVMATKNKISSIRVLYGDPFHWGPSDSEENKWEWKLDSTITDYLSLEYQTENYDFFFIEATPKFKRMRYAFLIDEKYLFGARDIVDITEHPDQLLHHFNYFNFPFINIEDAFNPPSWVQDQIWYSIFPERFANGDPSINPKGTLPWGKTDEYSNMQRFGGDIQGIIDHLDYIVEIGFTGIYMTPLFESDSSHKYDVNDYFKIDAAFGTNELLGKLVQEAHKRGLKVMLDAVYNHSGFRHPFFQDVIKNGKDSIYYDCFYIIDQSKPLLSFQVLDDGRIDRKSVQAVFKDKQKLNYRTFAFTPYMPKLNTSHPLMKKHLFDAATYWINEFNIDGWRLDVSDEVSHQFWREFRQKIKQAKSDAYIIGENWANSYPWLKGDQYDGVMNYEFLFIIWNYFGTNIDHKQYTSTEFKYRINHVLASYPRNVITAMYNLVDSHDTTRILEICANNINLVKLPYLFMFTLPGAPSVFYGGEIGLSGKHDPDNRRCMIWDETKQNQDLKTHIQKLIYLRKTYPALKQPSVKWIETNDKGEYIIYQKADITIIISKRYKENLIVLPETMQNQRYYDLYQDKEIVTKKELSIPSYGFYLLQKK